MTMYDRNNSLVTRPWWVGNPWSRKIAYGIGAATGALGGLSLVSHE